MNYPLLTTYALTVMILILTPGPVVMLIIRTAAAQGGRQALATIAGTNLASLLLIIFTVAILFGLVTISPIVLNIGGLIGCFYLSYLGVQGLKSETAPQEDKGRIGGKNGFTPGLMIGLSNPKDILFFLAFFPQFIHVAPQITTGIITLTLIWIALDITILCLYVALVRRLSTRKLAFGNGLARSASWLLLLTGIIGIGINGSEMWR